MVKWLAGIVVFVVVMAVVNPASGDDAAFDLKGTWTGRVVRHVTQKGFVPFYSGMRLVVEEQNSTQFKGHMAVGAGRDEPAVQFTGAIDLNNEYLYLRLASGDVCVGQIAAGNHLILFFADSLKDTVTVFRLRKTEAP
jgi:hypothetical protein